MKFWRDLKHFYNRNEFEIYIILLLLYMDYDMWREAFVQDLNILLLQM